MTYSERLKHPKWQRRRLEILSRADFRCEKCGADDQELHVHHKAYRDGAEPWDYADTELIALCATCHDFEHKPVYSAAEMAAVVARIESLEKVVELLKASIDDQTRREVALLRSHDRLGKRVTA